MKYAMGREKSKIDKHEIGKLKYLLTATKAALDSPNKWKEPREINK